MKQTVQLVRDEDASCLASIENESVDVVVTSPPYPMIEMWDSSFQKQDDGISDALREKDGAKAFRLMHALLEKVWRECYRVLRRGAFACINIGDATRKIGDGFKLYPNHAQILTICETIGFEALPLILWRKQTNAPNKFMGSGMLPAGAYVTLEHEYIIILRKGPKANTGDDARKRRRRESAIFWEERNRWYSDMWDFKGSRQDMVVEGNDDLRRRSAAFPFELAYRLINMYSLKGDTVLDPFLGTGTTLLAGICAGRNTVGYEMEKALVPYIERTVAEKSEFINKRIETRLQDHENFVKERASEGRELKHFNSGYGFPVVTGQETDLFIQFVKEITRRSEKEFVVSYEGSPGPRYIRPVHLTNFNLGFTQPTLPLTI